MTIFTSTSAIPGYPGYPERSGERVEVVRPLIMGDAPTDEVDWEAGPMFLIRFADGIEMSAWQDELTPAPAHPQMEEYERIMAEINRDD